MYLIDKDYFIKSIAVPNVEEPSSDNALELEISIDKYARQFLQFTLFNVLFTELDSYITNGVLSNAAPQKWLNLVNGCDYTVGDVTYTWKGLLVGDGLYKSSILAHYTYLNHYQNDINTQLGQIVIEPKNGVNVNPTEHLVTIHNEYVEMYQGNTCTHPTHYFHSGVLFVDYYGSNHNNGYVSYLQFLMDNKIDYPNISANYLSYQNQLGL